MKRIALCLGFLIACGSGSKAPSTPTTAGGVVEGKIKSADGLELVYDVRGQGDTTLAFVHCWSCDRTFWRNQVDTFAKRYRVVTLDLGGHGQSGANREAWTLASLGADVQAVIEKLDAKHVILVGHSMGGPVALDAARRMPDRVDAVVCADTLHDTQKMPEEMSAQLLKMFEADFQGTVRQGMRMLFREGAPKDVVDFVVEKQAAGNPAVMLPLMRENMNLDLASMFEAVKQPIRCINAEPKEPFAPVTDIEGNRKHADFDAVIMEGVGHFLQLEQPEGFNARLETTLQSLKR